MQIQINVPILIWAARDITRKPKEALWLAMLIALFINVIGVPLLFSEGLSGAARKILSSAPSLVLRVLDAGGWSSVPTRQVLPLLKAVPGVTRVRARVWGIARGPLGPVTLIGLDEEMLAAVHPDNLPLAQFKGSAIIGPGVLDDHQAVLNIRHGSQNLAFRIFKQLSRATSMVAHDVVLLHPDDVRYLLGIPDGHATDVAIDVFHETEETAIMPDLTDALPWPMRVVSRSEILGLYAGAFSFHSGIYLMMLVPAVFTLVLWVAMSGREIMGRRYEVGLYKVLGWQSGDIVRLQLYRALIISVPAIAIGITLACVMVYWPGVTWMGRLFLGWNEMPPFFYLDIRDGAWVVIELVALVLLPYLTGTLWSAIRGAAADPLDYLESEGV
jgi:hypothetical protein